jgi:hypothetical protein
MIKKTFIIFICLVFLICCGAINQNKPKIGPTPYLDHDVVIMFFMGETLNPIFGHALLVSLDKNILDPFVVYNKELFEYWLKSLPSYNRAMLIINLENANNKKIYIPERILSYTEGTFFPLFLWPYLSWHAYTTSIILPALNLELKNLLISTMLFDVKLNIQIGVRKYIVSENISNPGLKPMAEWWASKIVKDLKKKKTIRRAQIQKDDFSWLDKYSPKKK